MHVLWSLHRGGAERLVLDIAQEQLSTHEVCVVAISGGEMLPLFKDRGIEVIVVDEYERTLSSRRKLVKKLRSIVDQWKPDLMHTHLGGDVWAGLFIARAKRIPWVITVHSHEPGLSALSRLLRFFAFRTASHVVAISASVAEMVRYRYGVSQERLSVIPVGLRQERFELRDHRLPGDLVKCVIVGRLAPEKGHEVAFRALAKLSFPWELRIVGDGVLKRSLQQLAQELGIAQRIRWVGAVNEPGYFLTTSDLFLLPSLHEGQGLVLLEAMMSGLPAIASDLPVLREHFTHKQLATFPIGDADVLARVITSSLREYHLALQRADEARSIVQKHFGLFAVVEAYHALYATLIV